MQNSRLESAVWQFVLLTWCIRVGYAACGAVMVLQLNEMHNFVLHSMGMECFRTLPYGGEGNAAVCIVVAVAGVVWRCWHMKTPGFANLLPKSSSTLELWKLAYGSIWCQPPAFCCVLCLAHLGRLWPTLTLQAPKHRHIRGRCKPADIAVQVLNLLAEPAWLSCCLCSNPH